MWTVEYNNDTGPDDEGFWEWWAVTDGKRNFDQDDAAWLVYTLNTLETK